jgi:cytosine/uracil/thiamine/allantoin permease
VTGDNTLPTAGFLQTVGVVSSHHFPSVFATIYNYAWFVGFAIAAVIHLLGTRILQQHTLPQQDMFKM